MRKNYTVYRLAMLFWVCTGVHLLQAQPCATPTNVTATPTVFCPGGTVLLNATSSGNNIYWYNVPSGGSALGNVPSGLNFTVSPPGTTTYYAEAVGVSNGIQTFNHTGASQSFTVPGGITTIHVDVYGAQGGSNGGQGGRVQADLAVTPGQVLQINVGGQGGNSALGVVNGGFNGGGNSGSCGPQYCGSGGGGASDIRQGGTALTDRVIVAGGGGGSHPINGPSNAGAGGGLVGGSVTSTGNGCLATYATGGTQSAGGTPATSTGACCTGVAVPGGSLGQGGNGQGPTGNCNGGDSGSGGGGGYYGGGGGFVYSSGGGGSSYTGPGATNVVHNQGVRTGHGQIIITWLGTACSASPRVPVTVTTDNIPPVANCTAVTVTLDSTGNGSTTAAAVGSGSTDNCAVTSRSLAQTAFTCADAGVQSVVLTVSDGSGNTSTCTASITVVGQPVQASVSALTSNCGYNVSCNGVSDGIGTAAGSSGCPPYTYLWSNFNNSAVVPGLGVGTYTVTVTDATGSTGVATVTLVAPSPLTISTGTITSACAGDSAGTADITASGGNDCLPYTYAWSNGALTEDLSNAVPGTYTVTVTDAVGCSATQTVTIPALPSPTPAISQNGNTLTSTQSWTTYQWLLNGNPIPGATNNSYTATQSGNYSLVVTDNSGCSGTSSPVTVTIVGINVGMQDWNGLSLYPNPAHNEFRLRTASPIGYGITVRTMDLIGRMIAVQQLSELGSEAAFDIRDLTTGTYFIEVTSTQGQRKLFKLVVE